MARPFDPATASAFCVRQAPVDNDASALMLDRWGPSIPGAMPAPLKTFDVRHATAEDKCPTVFYECPIDIMTKYAHGYAASLPKIGGG